MSDRDPDAQEETPGENMDGWEEIGEEYTGWREESQPEHDPVESIRDRANARKENEKESYTVIPFPPASTFPIRVRESHPVLVVVGGPEVWRPRSWIRLS